MKKQLKKNVILSALNVFISGCILFFIFKIILKNLGSSQMGVWSVVLASVSASKISEFGLAGSAVKYVSKYYSLKNNEKAAEVVDTTSATISLSLALALLILYPLIKYVLKIAIPQGSVELAYSILPYAVVSIWLTSITSCYISGLDGVMRTDLRIYGSIFTSLVFAVLVNMLIPTMGLIGVAIAQIVQTTLLLIISYSQLKRILPLRIFNWNLLTFKEMITYGVNFQVILIFYMLAEPATKLLITKFGGLDNTAYFEMASRLVTQFRSILVSANQAIVPRIAHLYETNKDEILKAYHFTYSTMFTISTCMFFSLILGARLISYFWVGHIQDEFVKYTIWISLGFWLNTITVPSYFICLGTAKLKWNTLGHVSFGFLNILLSFFLGLRMGGDGVVLGYLISLFIGSMVIILGYHISNKISFFSLHSFYDLYVVTLCASVVSLYLYKNNYEHFNLWKESIWIFCILIFILFTPFLNGDFRNKLYSFLRK